jgi:hypothetical protein
MSTAAGALGGLRWSAMRESTAIALTPNHLKATLRSEAGADELQGAQSGELVIHPRSVLDMSVDIDDTSTLAAGRYAFTALPDFVDTKGEPPAPQAPTIRFQPRTPTKADELEILQRTAETSPRHARYDDAQATAQLRGYLADWQTLLRGHVGQAQPCCGA